MLLERIDQGIEERGRGQEEAKALPALRTINTSEINHLCTIHAKRSNITDAPASCELVFRFRQRHAAPERQPTFNHLTRTLGSLYSEVLNE
jgi:hypothetical protein